MTGYIPTKRSMLVGYSFTYSLQVSFSEIHLTPVSPSIVYMFNLLFLFQGKKKENEKELPSSYLDKFFDQFIPKQIKYPL
jgi:hypothetical protein